MKLEDINIYQLSQPRTGSTLLLNILYGLLYPLDEPCSNYKIIKSHNFGVENIIDACVNKKGETLRYHLKHDDVREMVKNEKNYIICSQRTEDKDQPVLHPSTGPGYGWVTNPNVIIIDYENLLETESNSVADIVNHVANKLKNTLPKDIEINVENGIKRIENMNEFYKTIKHLPFSYVENFYFLHGHHRNRG